MLNVSGARKIVFVNNAFWWEVRNDIALQYSKGFQIEKTTYLEFEVSFSPMNKTLKFALSWLLLLDDVTLKFSRNAFTKKYLGPVIWLASGKGNLVRSIETMISS